MFVKNLEILWNKI